EPMETYGNVSASEAIAEYEARQAALRTESAPADELATFDVVEEAEEILDLPAAAELPAQEHEDFGADFLPSPMPRTASPAPAIAMLAEAEVEEALVEADVFRKYGLLEKAAEQLKSFAKARPDALKVREKLFEIYLEQGKKAAARREAESLKETYRADGREDRIRALDTLLAEPEAPAARPEDALRSLTAPKAPPRRAPKAVSAREIEIPLPPPAAAP